MQKNVITSVGELSLADAAVGNASIGFNGNKAELFVNDVDPGKGAVNADLTAATFTGSTPVAITWGAPYLNAEGDAEVASQLLSWTYASGDAETVFGISLRDGTTRTIVNGYAKLDLGKEMGVVTDTLQVVLRLTMSDEGWGVSVQVSQ